MSTRDEISFNDKDKVEFMGFIDRMMGQIRSGSLNLEWYAFTDSEDSTSTEVTFRVDKVPNGSKEGPEGV